MNGIETRELGLKALDFLKREGASDASVLLGERRLEEMNFNTEDCDLARSVVTEEAQVACLLPGGRQGRVAGGLVSWDALESTCREALALARSAGEDPARAMAPSSPAQVFDWGAQEADREAMLRLARATGAAIRQRFPAVLLEMSQIAFVERRQIFLNSNGVDLTSRTGWHEVSIIFAAKREGKVSSFQTCTFQSREIPSDVLAMAHLSEQLRQAEEQTQAKPLCGKFEGDVIWAPQALGAPLWFLVNSLSNGSMIAGTSLYKGKLGENVASGNLSFAIDPRGEGVVPAEFVTVDGFVAERCPVLERGRLANYQLTLYGANRTGLARAPAIDGCWEVGAGSTSLAEIVASTRRGLLVGRFSGGTPAGNGDFAGVAKNSYYIEDGRILFPVSEAMMSGNMASVLRSVDAVSSERIDTGSSRMPWVRTPGLVVSGKS